MCDNREELVRYRLEAAQEKLDSAKILLDSGKLKDSIGRSYYTMFTCVRALTAVDGIDFSKHAGVISYFQKEYIKTGKIDVNHERMQRNSIEGRKILRRQWGNTLITEENNLQGGQIKI